MRIGYLLAVAILLAAGASVAAQEAVAPENVRPPFRAEWRQLPAGRDFARHYPRGAVQRRLEGGAILCCRPRTDGRLSCELGAESPAGEGFGAAAIRLSRLMRMERESLTAFQSDPQNYLQIPIYFHIDRPANDGARLKRELEAETLGLCQITNAPSLDTPARP